MVSSCTSRPEADLTLVTVEDLSYTLLPGGARIVTGTVYNPTEYSLGSIQLQISLFDKDNIRVDGLGVLIRDLEPQARIPFREAVDSDFDVTAARVKGMISL